MGTRLLGQLRQRATEALLDVFRILGRRTQCHRDVIGDLVAGNRDHRGVTDRAVGEHRHISGAAADVDQTDAEVFFIFGQHRHR